MHALLKKRTLIPTVGLAVLGLSTLILFAKRQEKARKGKN